MQKDATDIDRHVGALIKLRRLEIGMSQQMMGHALGVTFQQVQKYENGQNRLTVGRLVEVAGTLGVHTSYFLGQSPTPPSGELIELISALSSSPDLVRTLRTLSRAAPELQRSILHLVEAAVGT